MKNLFLESLSLKTIREHIIANICYMGCIVVRIKAIQNLTRKEKSIFDMGTLP